MPHAIYGLNWTTDYDTFFRDAEGLIRTHWAETGSNRDILRFNPDHEIYRRAARAGALQILLAHDDVGEIAGYFILFITPHPRDKDASLAQDDALYVRPKSRQDMLGPRMYREALSFCEHAGVTVVHFRAKDRQDAVLRRAGFREVSTTWTKVLRIPHPKTTDEAA